MIISVEPKIINIRKQRNYLNSGEIGKEERWVGEEVKWKERGMMKEKEGKKIKEKKKEKIEEKKREEKENEKGDKEKKEN